MDNTYSSISEAIYYASHNIETDEEIIPEVQPIDVKFDLKPIIDLALDTKDIEWFHQLVNEY